LNLSNFSFNFASTFFATGDEFEKNGVSLINFNSLNTYQTSFQYLMNPSNMIDATGGTGIAYHSGSPEFIPGFFLGFVLLDLWASKQHSMSRMNGRSIVVRRNCLPVASKMVCFDPCLKNS
jgi:hypothetical protein